MLINIVNRHTFELEQTLELEINSYCYEKFVIMTSKICWTGSNLKKAYLLRLNLYKAILRALQSSLDHVKQKALKNLANRHIFELEQALELEINS